MQLSVMLIEVLTKKNVIHNMLRLLYLPPIPIAKPAANKPGTNKLDTDVKLILILK